MKKFMFFAAMMLLTSVFMNSSNTISLGDEVRIPPRFSGGYFKMDAIMTINGMCDAWDIAASYPQGMSVKLVAGIEALDGMTVGYTDYTGANQTFQAPLQVSAAYATISSVIGETGYWDLYENGTYVPYGTVKWEPGEYEMFSLNFYVDPTFRSGDITFNGLLTSGADQRGPVLQGVRFFKRTHVWVGYLRGDMNGDERLTIADVTMLISFVLNPDNELYDEWQRAAADVNGDGEARIDDVTLLISKVLNN